MTTSDKPRIFIAGPMSGYPHFNRAGFDEAAEFLRGRGWLVHSPVEADVAMYGDKLFSSNGKGDIGQAVEQFGFAYRDALAHGLSVLCKDCDAIYLLEGWINSKGAYAEYTTARALDLKIVVQGFYSSNFDDPIYMGDSH